MRWVMPRFGTYAFHGDAFPALKLRQITLLLELLRTLSFLGPASVTLPLHLLGLEYFREQLRDGLLQEARRSICRGRRRGASAPLGDHRRCVWKGLLLPHTLNLTLIF